MKYKKFWTDMHSNIHHGQINELPAWYEQVKKTDGFLAGGLLSILYAPHTSRTCCGGSIR